MEVASIVCEVHFGCDEESGDRTRDMSRQEHHTFFPICPQVVKPREELADPRGSQIGPLRLDHEMERAPRSPDRKPPVPPEVTAAGRRVGQRTHEGEAPKTIERLGLVTGCAGRSVHNITMSILNGQR